MANRTKTLSEKEIDEMVARQADDGSAWEEPVRVQWIRLSLKSLPFPVSLPSELAERAAFFAELRGEASVEDWLIHIIQERIDFESAVLAYLAKSPGEESVTSLPFGFAERVAFFAKRHRAPSAKIWVAQVIQKQIKSEEADFRKLKRELTASK